MNRSDVELCFGRHDNPFKVGFEKGANWKKRRDSTQFSKDRLIAIFSEAMKLKARSV